MKQIEKKLNDTLLVKMAFSVIFAIIGLIIFLKSDMLNSTVEKIIGIFLILFGVKDVYISKVYSKVKIYKYDIFFGILNVLLGIFIMWNPFQLINLLNIGLGIWILIEGLNKFFVFMILKKGKEESNKIILMSSLLSFFMGIVLIINPIQTLVITKIIGIFIMLYSLLNLNDYTLIKKKRKNIVKLFK